MKRKSAAKTNGAQRKKGETARKEVVMDWSDLPKQDHYEHFYKFPCKEGKYKGRQIMEVSGYIGKETQSPKDFYVVAWPWIGTYTLPPVITMIPITHRELATQAKFAPDKLQYSFYATRGDQEYNNPLLDAPGLNSCIPFILQQEPEFLRIDGTFFSISIEPLVHSESFTPSVCFSSFFKMPLAIRKIYMLSGYDAGISPGQTAIEGDLEKILDMFPTWQSWEDYKEELDELRQSP